MDVYADGKKVSLTPADFRAQGGEGSVYVKKEIAYKIFTDPAKAVPPAKIAELAVLARPEILRPQVVLRDRAGVVVGYTMQAVPDAFPLCRTFTRTFCDLHRLTPDIIRHLVRQLQTGVAHVHTHGILLVDLNETNFLVDTAFDKVFFIDVDSYQTPHFPATALMETVRDRHSIGFSMDTDWFAFAIVSFQMFVGIHPYKGKHPELKTLDARMRAHVSVLNPDVALPAVCPPLSALPNALRDWYESVLEGGARCSPPAVWVRSTSFVFTPTSLPALSGEGLFHREELDTFDDDIIGCEQGIVITRAGVVYKGRTCLHPDVQIGLLPHSGSPVAAWMEQKRIRFYDLAQCEEVASDMAGEAVLASEGRLYVQQDGALLEVEFHAFPSGLRAGTRLAASVMPQATFLGDGVLLQNMVGTWYATLPESGGRAPQVRLSEMDGAQIVEARYRSRVLMVTVRQRGLLHKWIFRFDAAQGYDIRRIADIATGGVNFIVLSTGVCLHLTDEGELEIFSHRRGAGEVRTLTDPQLSADCRLFANGAQALFARGRTLYQFSLRKSA